MQETWFDSWVRKIHWRRDRLPTPVFSVLENSMDCVVYGVRKNCSLDHIKSKRIPEKHLLLLYAKAFDYVDNNKLWKIPKEMGIPDRLTCLLRNLYAGQEATARTRHGTTNGLVPNWKRSTSRLYIVTLPI